MRKPIFAETGPEPKGPYSPAIQATGSMLYISGQGPVEPSNGEFQLGEFREQTVLTLDNVSRLLEAGGSSWKNVVKVSVFLADMDNFSEFNHIYESYVAKPYPARTTVQSDLSLIAIEIDCIALINDD